MLVLRGKEFRIMKLNYQLSRCVLDRSSCKEGRDCVDDFHHRVHCGLAVDPDMIQNAYIVSQRGRQ